MNDVIKRVDCVDGSTPLKVGHYYFGATCKTLGTLPRDEALCVELIPLSEVFTANQVFTIVLNGTSNECDWELRVRSSITNGKLLIGEHPQWTTTNGLVEPDNVKALSMYDGSKNRYALCVYFPKMLGAIACSAKVNAVGIELNIFKESDNPSSIWDDELINDYSMDFIAPYVVPTMNFGPSLPDPGIPGRIFFLEVQDE